MKKIQYALFSVAFLFIMLPQAVWSQPQMFNYQGVARNAAGAPLINKNIGLRFTILTGTATGSMVYRETQNVMTNQFGLFNVQIGNGVADSGTMAGVKWGTGAKYLEVELDPAGGTSYTNIGTTQLVSVPYALQAATAGTATGAGSVQWAGVKNVPSQLFHRSIYVPAAAFARNNSSSNIYPNNWGLFWANSTEKAGFTIPKPADWDSSKVFTVTIYFAFPSLSSSTSINWRINAGSNLVNSTSGATGWDSFDYWDTQDAGLTSYASSGGYTDICKSQTFTPLYSTTYNSWYFGSGVTTNDDFSNTPIWHFTFTRGNSVSNGETYTGDLTVVGVEVDYTAVH